MGPEAHLGREATPLPKLQLFLILLVLFAEPITSTVIFPFINQVCSTSRALGETSTHACYSSLGDY